MKETFFYEDAKENKLQKDKKKLQIRFKEKYFVRAKEKPARKFKGKNNCEKTKQKKI